MLSSRSLPLKGGVPPFARTSVAAPRKANAKKISVRLDELENDLRLIVQDNGIGFDPHNKASTGHFGLVGMQERAALSGGKLTINSQKGKGTQVILEI